MRTRILLNIVGVIVLLVFLAGAQNQKPTVSLVVSTEPLATLLPHAHGAGDKVSDVHHGVAVSSTIVEVPETMWVTELTVSAVNAPRSVIHHLHMLRLNPDGSGRIPEDNSVFTVGPDVVSTVTFPSPSGMFFAKGEKIAIDAVLHNPVPPLGEGGIYKDVVVRVTLKGVRNGEGRYVPLYFDLPRVTDSTSLTDDDSTFTVPVGTELFTRTSEDNPEGAGGASHVFANDGWIVSMGAHMHAWEGAKRVDAYLNGERFRTYTSTLLDPKIPWSFESEYGPVFTRVKQGDVLTVSATYENQNPVPLEGAMGMIGVYYTSDSQFSLARPWYQVLWSIQGWFLGVWDAISSLRRAA